MNLDKVFVADIETTGLLEDLKKPNAKLHVLSVAYKNGDKYELKSTNKEEDVVKFFTNPENTIAGHNFLLYDVPAIERLYNIKVKATIIDTLFLSWYIEPNRIKEGKKHGLESYGFDFGREKEVIEDDEWENLSYEKAEKRCERDVEINTNLFVTQLNKLRVLYEQDDEKVKSLIRFLGNKGEQYKEHQDNPLNLHVKQALKNKSTLEKEKSRIVGSLSKVMPKVKNTAIRTKPKSLYKKSPTKPKKMYLKSGDLTSAGEKWFNLLDEYGLPHDHDGEIEILSSAGEKWLRLTKSAGLPLTYEGEIKEVLGYDEPNPQSTTQVKDWLFSFGWEPLIFKETFLKSGEVNRVPQLKDKDGNLCKSVLKLAEKEPAILDLENLGIIQHRLGIIKGFLRDCDEDGNIVAGIAGLTNTLRIRHKVLVNLPKPSASYGQYIRSLIRPQEGLIMIGSDLSSLENVTRNNFILPYDPEYVKEMDGKYYDSHLDIGIVANLITESEALFYKWWKEKKKNPEIKMEEIGKVPEDYRFLEESYKTDEQRQDLFDKIDKKRAQAKTVNYSALYKVGATKLSKELGIKKIEAQNLLDAFWKRNKSVIEFSDSCEVKTIDGQMWVKNPLNGYWYSLRSEKDIFSTVNQGTGDYIFTLWVHFVRKLGVIVQFGAHDELVTTCKPEDKDEVIEKLYKAINQVNEVLQLEIPVGIDYNVGNNYSEVH